MKRLPDSNLAEFDLIFSSFGLSMNTHRVMLQSSSVMNLPTLKVPLFNGASVNVSLVIFKSGVFFHKL